MSNKGGGNERDMQRTSSGGPDEVQPAGSSAAVGRGRGRGKSRDEGSRPGSGQSQSPRPGASQQNQQGGGQHQGPGGSKGGQQGQGRGRGRGQSPRVDSQQFPSQEPNKPAQGGQGVASAPEPSNQEKPSACGKSSSQPTQPATDAPPSVQLTPSHSSKATVEEVSNKLSSVSLEGEDQTVPKSSPTKDAPQKTTGKLCLPKRKNPLQAGTLGRPIQVYTNMMEIKIGSNFKPHIIHYDVNIEPDKPKYLMRDVLEDARKQLFPNKVVVFDGRKNAFSPGPLPFGDYATCEVTVRNENDAEKKFKITLKQVAVLDLSWMKNVGPGMDMTENKHSGIQALDVILRNAPGLRAIPVGRSFFAPPRANERIISLGGGMDLWTGHFQSAIVGWKPFLNIDVAHKGFPTPQPVINLMRTLCGCDAPRGGGRPQRGGRQQYGRQDFRDQGPTELTVELITRHREEINRFLKGLKVTFQIPNDSSSRRVQRVNELVRCPKDNSFQLDDGRVVTIEQYYKLKKQYTIKYPYFPCLWVGNREKNIHIPVELCTIVPGQSTQKKLNEQQTSEMIRHAATGTEIRANKIMNAYDNIGYNDDPCMKEFGISVSGEFAKIPARVLDPPRLTYKNRDVDVSKGVWRADKFLEPTLAISGDNSWTILNLSFRTQERELYEFYDKLRNIAGTLGVQMGKPSAPFGNVDTRRNCMNQLKTYFTTWKNNNIKLVIVIIPESKGEYNWVKQVAELSVGILTQCLKSKTLFKIKNDRSPATLTNILLKINAKLNGINHMISPKSLQQNLPFCLDEPCMIVGADVTHPSPDAKDTPSIAAVVASHDKRALFQYNTEIRLQPAKQEIIGDLAGIMRKQLEFFKKQTGYWPLRIIFYRDGVGEGHFKQVLEEELMAIRKACNDVKHKVGGEYQPPITFLVVQKRHHTRFFPASSNETDDKNVNVRAGTVVDTHITHPTDIDFYLASHASIQGTARPTKYRCLWNDSNMTEDQLQELTYYLCHLFTRCTRTVSYPAPTYYAHCAAFRARAWTYDVNIDLNNLTREQAKKLTAIPEFLNNNPMFFV